MAKGDDSRVRNAIDEEGKRQRQMDENLRVGVLDPQYGMMFNNYQDDRAADSADYGQLKSGFDEFSRTGGFSPQDISSFRARAAAPIRSAFDSANREVNRARTLSGGNMPGYAVLRSRLARDTSQGMSDSTINANAEIARLVQQGRLSGLSGGSNLYGTTPGRSALSSQNLRGITGDYLNANQLAAQSGLGILGERNKAAQIKDKWSGIGGIAKSIIGAAAPFFGGGGGGGGGIGNEKETLYRDIYDNDLPKYNSPR